MFKDFNLSDEEVLDIIKRYENLINKNSMINFQLNETMTLID